MPTVLDPDSEEPLLTLDEAYVAAWYFVLQFYERDGVKPESMFFLLDWMQLVGKRESSDPALWHDWLASVQKALDRESGDFHFPPIPAPGRSS